MLGRCLESIASSSYANYEVIILENFSEHRETFAYYRQLERRSELRIVPWTKPFNYAAIRSEEHTSELQSLRHLVCRLRLEKNKTYSHRARRWRLGEIFEVEAAG